MAQGPNYSVTSECHLQFLHAKISVWRHTAQRIPRLLGSRPPVSPAKASCFGEAALRPRLQHEPLWLITRGPGKHLPLHQGLVSTGQWT